MHFSVCQSLYCLSNNAISPQAIVWNFHCLENVVGANFIASGHMHSAYTALFRHITSKLKILSTLCVGWKQE